jgi:hypothetical protein
VAAARRDQCAVALADDPLLTVDGQAPLTCGDEIELLGEAVVVLGRGAAGFEPSCESDAGRAVVLYL